MEQSESVKTLAAALVAAQKEIEGAAKDKVNPHFKSRYADLSSIWEACKPALNKNGIAVIQSPAPSETAGALALETTLLHSSGEWMRGRAIVPLGKNDPQGYGSAMTYARRYSLAAMVGVCPEDDDGEAAAGRRANGARAAQHSLNGNGITRAAPSPTTATPAQVKEIKDLLGIVRIPSGTIEKWFAKAEVFTWEEMPAETVAKCIEFVKAKLPVMSAA